MSETIFALDIGTRNVVGIVARKRDRTLYTQAAERIEHATRTMRDGQIHDVEEVARIVKIIKNRLEKKTKLKLRKVAVAVAGRALKTVRTKINRDISHLDEVTKEEVLNLELVAVDKILEKLQQKSTEHPAASARRKTHTDYYCVDYSVVHYELDKTRINNLVGHRGRNISVEVLATFLPHGVLSSLYGVLKRANLEVMSLTLEPIAAISVVVPPDMRELNLALIDIGAGTSDIAIANHGTIIAYGMIPMAGDEITEKLCKKHILHFPVGEKVKKSLAKKKEIEFENSLRKYYKIESKILLDELDSEIDSIARHISKEVLKLNGGAPEGVICVGGTSRLPRLKEKIARELGINEERITAGDPGMIKHIKMQPRKHGIHGNTETVLIGPESVTPIGIAYTAGKAKGLQFLDVKVNGKPIQLINIGGELNVFKALVVAGVDTQNLHGKDGKDLVYYLDAKEGVIKGEAGTPCQIKINARAANLEQRIEHKDEIEVTPAKDGKDAQGRIKDIIGTRGRKRITINGIKTQISPIIFMNGREVDYETQISDEAKIEVDERCTIDKALAQAGFELPAIARSIKKKEITITVNGKKKTLVQSTHKIILNGKEANFDKEIKDGDEIEFISGEDILYKIRDVVKPPRDGEDIKVRVNDKPFIIKGAKGRIYMNDEEVHLDEIVTDGAEIVTTDGRKARPHLSRIFQYLPKSSISMRGKALKITVNGKKARFITNLKDGDVVKVFFE